MSFNMYETNAMKVRKFMKEFGQEVKDILVYWSKKTKSWRPVKEKDMGSIFFEIKGKGKDPIDYVLIEELV